MARNTARNRNVRNAVRNRGAANARNTAGSQSTQNIQNVAGGENVKAQVASNADVPVNEAAQNAENAANVENSGVATDVQRASDKTEVSAAERGADAPGLTDVSDAAEPAGGQSSTSSIASSKASVDRPINQATAAQAAAHALGMGLRMRRMMTGKIHRVTVTGADLHYVGSITIDADLLDGADILPGQEVDVVDITNGARLTTYAIPGERGSGVISINGAAAHLINEGDLAIVISYSLLDDASCRTYEPRVVFVDESNRPIDVSSEPGQAPAGADVVSSGIPFEEYRD